MWCVTLSEGYTILSGTSGIYTLLKVGLHKWFLANQRLLWPTLGSPVMTFHQSSSWEWCKSTGWASNHLCKTAFRYLRIVHMLVSTHGKCCINTIILHITEESCNSPTGHCVYKIVVYNYSWVVHTSKTKNRNPYDRKQALVVIHVRWFAAQNNSAVRVGIYWLNLTRRWHNWLHN